MAQRGFGSIRKLPSGRYQARYVGPDLNRHAAPATFSNKSFAEAWLADERRYIERGNWSPPTFRQAERRRAADEARRNTFGAFAQSYLTSRDLRPTTVAEYRRVLERSLLPTFEDMPLSTITLADVKRWHTSLRPSTPSANAAAYRLLRSILNAAEQEELLDRSPARIRKASTAKVARVAIPATIQQIETITDAMPPRLRLLIVLAAYCGLREGELLELRRADVDIKAGSLTIARTVAKDANPDAPGACANCGRVIGPPKTAAGRRTVHVPPPFLPLLRSHLLEHAAAGADGLLFPGQRSDHMSARYLMDRYRDARERANRPDLTLHHLRHTALTLAGQQGATAAELKHRAGHSSHAAMAIYQHASNDRDRLIAERLGVAIEEERLRNR